MASLRELTALNFGHCLSQSNSNSSISSHSRSSSRQAEAIQELLLLWPYHEKEIQEPLASLRGAQDVAMSVANLVLFDEYERSLLSPLSLPGGEKSPIAFNSRGLPIRLDEADCKYYMRTGCCDYGASCKFNHPETSQQGLQGGLSLLQPPLTPRALRPTKGVSHQPPRMRESHPMTPHVFLTQAGYPRREGEMVCRFYMKTGFCGYGAECRFDHPPPEAAAAMALNMYSISRLSLR